MAIGAPNAATGAGVAPKLGVGAAGAPNTGAGVGGAMPPLLAPDIFSCVLPYAAIPNTAPMARWEKARTLQGDGHPLAFYLAATNDLDQAP